MSAYWWECEKCGRQYHFETGTGVRDIAHYIRDVLAKEWDQRFVMGRCPDCLVRTLRLTCGVPGVSELAFHVVGIVGLDARKDGTVPMLWGIKRANSDAVVHVFKALAGKRKPQLVDDFELTQEEQKALRAAMSKITS